MHSDCDYTIWEGCPLEMQGYPVMTFARGTKASTRRIVGEKGWGQIRRAPSQEGDQGIVLVIGFHEHLRPGENWGLDVRATRVDLSKQKMTVANRSWSDRAAVQQTLSAPDRISAHPSLKGGSDERSDVRVEERRFQNYRLYNRDLAPTTLKQRTWGTYNFTALWVGTAHCVRRTCWRGDVSLGMNSVQVLHDYPGQPDRPHTDAAQFPSGDQVRIPFPVFARSGSAPSGPTFRRSSAPSSPAAGSASTRTSDRWPSTASSASSCRNGRVSAAALTIAGLSIHGAIALTVFWLFQIWIIYNGMEAVRVFENWAAPSSSSSPSSS